MDKLIKNSKKWREHEKWLFINVFLIRCFGLLKKWRHQHDKWNNSGTENIWEEKDCLGYCIKKWSFLLNMF